MVYMVLWTIWNINQVSQVLLDQPEMMGLLDLLDKKVIEVTKERKVTEDQRVSQETWDPWVYQVLWVSLGLMDQMVLLVFLDKLAQWAQVVKKENVVIWVQWDTTVLKVKRATKATRDEEGD